jgi:hypothetical protein
LPYFIAQHFWPGVSVWVVLFISDFTLTLTCARLYRAGVKQKIVFEGSYELTPFFQRDIDSLRKISPRFFLVLGLVPAALFIIWELAVPVLPEAYFFLLGAFILSQLAIHTRHLRNLFIFRNAATEAVSGRIQYARRLSLRGSAFDLFSFAALYAVLVAFTQSWFIAGGVFGCMNIGFKHLRLASKQKSAEIAEPAKAAATTSH